MAFKPQPYRVSGTDIEYDFHEYWSGRDKVSAARLRIEELDLSPEDREEVLAICRDVIKGTVQACKAVYDPLTDPAKVKIVTANDCDLKTDLEGLKDISDKFGKPPEEPGEESTVTQTQ